MLHQHAPQEPGPARYTGVHSFHPTEPVQDLLTATAEAEAARLFAQIEASEERTGEVRFDFPHIQELEDELMAFVQAREELSEFHKGILFTSFLFTIVDSFREDISGRLKIQMQQKMLEQIAANRITPKGQA